MTYITITTMLLLPKHIREEIIRLRKERKAALRECGRLGDRLHATRLEIIVLRARVNELVHEERLEVTTLRTQIKELKSKVLDSDMTLRQETVPYES